MKTLITVNEVAHKLSISPKTVYRLINRGVLTRVKIGSATRISVNEVISYLNQQGIKEATV